jgi:glycosyltransferase involved in cell wall biosynthesis
VSVRVLHVFSTFAPGGPQVRTARLLARLPEDWTHAILALDGRAQAQELLPREARVALLPAPPRAGSLRTVRALAEILRRERPDLLLTYNWGAVDALLASHIVRPRAVVHHEDGFRPDELAGFKRRRVWLRRLLLPGCRAVVVPSYTLERLARELWRLPAELVRRIPNGIRATDFPPADGNPARRAELGIPPEALVIGSVGHLRPEKNPLRLVEALAELPAGAHLLLVGDGPERPGLERAAASLGLAARVHLVGHRSDPGPDYRSMDVFALSSDTEQMPVALLEAMASSLPVAATDVGDVRRILPAEEAAAIVPLQGQGTARALGRALARLGAEPDLRRRLGAANRARVERDFSFEGMVAAYRATYERALAGGAD